MVFKHRYFYIQILNSVKIKNYKINKPGVSYKMVFGSVLKSVLYKNNFQNPSTFKISTIGPLILDKQKCNPPGHLNCLYKKWDPIVKILNMSFPR